MDVRELTSEDRWQDRRVSHAALRAARALVKPADQKRLGCGDVARMRAARYAKRHRIAKPLWPLMAAFILVGLIFERRTVPVFSWGRTPIGDDEGATPMPGPSGEQGVDGLLDPAATVDTTHGDPEPRYRPPARFLARDISQVVAFLIRNRGRLDTPVVRAKWDHVDRLSLPLAIYLREIEAMDAWADLEKEISVAPFGAPAVSGMDIPKSVRHRKVLRLLPEWSRRGMEIMSSVAIGDATPEPTPGDEDDHSTKPKGP